MGGDLIMMYQVAYKDKGMTKPMEKAEAEKELERLGQIFTGLRLREVQQ